MIYTERKELNAHGDGAIFYTDGVVDYIIQKGINNPELKSDLDIMLENIFDGNRLTEGESVKIIRDLQGIDLNTPEGKEKAINKTYILLNIVNNWGEIQETMTELNKL